MPNADSPHGRLRGAIGGEGEGTRVYECRVSGFCDKRQTGCILSDTPARLSAAFDSSSARFSLFFSVFPRYYQRAAACSPQESCCRESVVAGPIPHLGRAWRSAVRCRPAVGCRGGTAATAVGSGARCPQAVQAIAQSLHDRAAPQGYHVRDLCSTLETMVNGQPIGRHFGTDDVLLRFGENEVIAGGVCSPFVFSISIPGPPARFRFSQ
jgi:hypothetical protein